MAQAVSLLTADDLAYIIPVGTDDRRELLEVELELLTAEHDLTLTKDEQSAVIGAWLALVAHHQPSVDYVPAQKGSGGAKGLRGGRGARAGSSGERPHTDTGYLGCSSYRISAVGLTYDVNGYDVIHLDPSWLGRYFASAHSVYTDMLICFRRELHMNPQVRGWDSIYDQIACHMLGALALQGGPTWDLEGYRGTTTLPWSWTAWSHMCNWG